MELHLKIIGCILIVLGIIHAGFPQYFNWRTELIPLSLINRQMVYFHTFFLALFVLLTGILCLTSAEEIVGTPLGKKLSLGFGLFWSIRLFVQFFGYSPQLWKGKKFETFVHILFTFLWTYISGVYFWISFH